MRSKKQQAQQKLWQSLGTVTGFYGYLNHLDTAYKRAGIEPAMTAALREDLKYAETVIRNKMRKLK